jgi:hypothetical protein
MTLLPYDEVASLAGAPLPLITQLSYHSILFGFRDLDTFASGVLV